VLKNARGLHIHKSRMHPEGEEDEEMDEEVEDEEAPRRTAGDTTRRTAGDTTRHTAGGHTAGGHTAGEHTAGGHTAGGRTSGWRTAGGHTAGDATRRTAGDTTRQPQPSVSGTSSIVSREAGRAAAVGAGVRAGAGTGSTGGRTPPTPPPPAPTPSRTDPAVSQPQSMTTGTSMAGLHDPRELTKGLRAWLKELKAFDRNLKGEQINDDATQANTERFLNAHVSKVGQCRLTPG